MTSKHELTEQEIDAVAAEVAEFRALSATYTGARSSCSSSALLGARFVTFCFEPFLLPSYACAGGGLRCTLLCVNCLGRFGFSLRPEVKGGE